jgi:hypothetical protein
MRQISPYFSGNLLIKALQISRKLSGHHTVLDNVSHPSRLPLFECNYYLSNGRQQQKANECDTKGFASSFPPPIHKKVFGIKDELLDKIPG